MSSRYNQAQIAPYWQSVWRDSGIFEASADANNPVYVLGMFPYTSGSIHMGHVRNYTITDAIARYRRMCGDDVLHPMGWDAFGLPAENAAYEHDTDPASWTAACISRMRDELENLGFGYDWSREISTCEPTYYRWNQWMFSRLYDAGLVEYKSATVNWCPACGTVLADAQVEHPLDDPDDATPSTTPSELDPRQGRRWNATRNNGGVCWRCGAGVERRSLPQWFFKITAYAEELHEGLDDLDGWPTGVRDAQRNWIGRQDGARITFAVPPHGDIDVFSARVDTIYGAIFVALSPHHPLTKTIADENEAVRAFVDTLDDPTILGADGVDTGLTAVHPLTAEPLPVYVAAYVLDEVGTGAVMGVPAHDTRDHTFALKHDLPIVQAIEPIDGSDPSIPSKPFTDDGRLIASDSYTGLESASARETLADEPAIQSETTYRLRDWLISRQRYWGTPIPVVHCDDCGPVLVPDEKLPVELPRFVRTTGNPLEANDAFVETECPDCGNPARRDTDTMDTFVDSSWYFLRFLSPDREDVPFDTALTHRWLPIDVYVGGDEHAVLHLLYIRFVTRALADLGLLTVREPVDQLINQGTVLYDGTKMSKSMGNVVAPHEYGAETTRLFVLSAAHPQQDFEWTAKSVRTAYDLQQQLFAMTSSFVSSDDARLESAPHDRYLEREIDRTIVAVTREYDRFRFHRVVSEIDGFARLLRRYRDYDTPYRFTYVRGLRILATLIAPITPYLAEEMWDALDEDGLAAAADWPTPLHDATDYRLERQYVQTTLEDVRDIIDVASIESPERIELVVASDWKFHAYDLARESDDDDLTPEQLIDDATVATYGDEAYEFVTTLIQDQAGLEPVLTGDRECTLLEQAAWLFEDEFGVEIRVRMATENDPLWTKADPNKPAINII